MLGKLDRLAFKPTPMSRRGFLKVTALAGAGFVVGCGPSEPETAATTPQAAPEPAAPPPAGPAQLNTFVRVGSDDTVTVIVKHLDKGQGVTTGLPTIVAEELDADWSQMRAEFSGADASKYNNFAFGTVQGTGGSTSIANSWMQLRQAAAAARAMLVGAAAELWEVPASEITVSKGRLAHAASGNEASFGALAARAADISPPAEPALKDPADFTLIGTEVPRLDSPAKTDGSAVFTIDVERPDMLTAVVAHPPLFGARVASVDTSAALAVPGVGQVVEIERGVAVLADSYWSATRGRSALSIEWDDSAAETRGTDALFAEFEQRVGQEGLPARNDGDAQAALGDADRIINAEYHFPYLAHATMEPMDAVVELKPDRCEIWTGAQLPTVDQNIVASITGLEPDQVIINTHYAGGSFGRRAVPDSDYIAEATMIAKAIGGRAPVKLVWSREDDMRAGRYRPMSVHGLAAGLDDQGNIIAWRHRAVMQSIMAGSPFEAFIQDGIDPASVEGARGLPYAIDNLRVDLHTMEVGVPVLWWRSVGHTHNAFVTEAFFDELAHAAGKDPYEFRRELLAGQSRLRGVLDLAAEKAGWNGTDLGPGRGRGIAVHESFSSYVAEVVDVTVGDDGALKVDKVVCAVDCGIAINPDVIRAQMEGGIAYALSAALREEVTLTDGRVDQGNFDTYRPLRIDEMPAIEVHIVPSGEAPTGVGEPGTPPLAPALAGAIFAATGKRLRRLPIGNQLRA